MSAYAVTIAPRAARQIQEIYDWYEMQQPQLGERFKRTFRDHVAQLGEFPLAHAPVYRGVRRLRSKPFPYHVYFRIRGDSVKILAVIHVARTPPGRRQLQGR